jgi:hypothetical protein
LRSVAKRPPDGVIAADALVEAVVLEPEEPPHAASPIAASTSSTAAMTGALRSFLEVWCTSGTVLLL